MIKKFIVYFLLLSFGSSSFALIDEGTASNSEEISDCQSIESGLDHEHFSEKDFGASGHSIPSCYNHDHGLHHMTLILEDNLILNSFILVKIKNINSSKNFTHHYINEILRPPITII